MSPAWEESSCSFSQEMFHVLWNTIGHYGGHYSSPLVRNP
jgi:hypothetical protein